MKLARLIAVIRMCVFTCSIIPGAARVTDSVGGFGETGQCVRARECYCNSRRGPHRMRGKRGRLRWVWAGNGAPVVPVTGSTLHPCTHSGYGHGHMPAA
ncbi:hypothetical protein XELAEV_18037536mg [Xenopus laevis]|uniref:Secreted protein n=1 Tax=Xenopus laevis TaxID=8355 RepID=A0A974CCH6_XENLA|nr:hypothetical protein XELAEV_18037536mg [Xenopus laevis]